MRDEQIAVLKDYVFSVPLWGPIYEQGGVNALIEKGEIGPPLPHILLAGYIEAVNKTAAI